MLTAAIVVSEVAVVTGGDSGIGFAIAKSLAPAGATTALLARNSNRLDQAVADIREHGGQPRGAVPRPLVRSPAGTPRSPNSPSNPASRE